MAGSEVHRRGLIVDLICIILLGIVVLLLHLLGTPYVRGFFCDDDSIRYPVVENTVPTSVMVSLGILVPIAVFTISEMVLACAGQYEDRADNGAVNIFGRDLPSPLSSWIRVAFIFFFGLGVSQVLVDIGKFTVGRLRPHFLAACLPDVDCESVNQDPHEYIDEYDCTSIDEATIKESRLSFPSGHSSIAFYSATYTIMYIESSFTWEGSRLIRHSIQLLLLLGAWFVALSRVSDYMHHWSDVLAGMAIGFFTALFTVLFVSDFYRSHWNVDAIELTPLRSGTGSRRMYAVADRGARP